jgi:NADH:ubiquinone oxidoreductase subunit 6 (subunit J)
MEFRFLPDRGRGARSILFVEHDLFQKPVSTPDHVGGNLFRDHARALPRLVLPVRAFHLEIHNGSIRGTRHSMSYRFGARMPDLLNCGAPISRTPMHPLISRSGPVVVRIYAALAYVASVALLYGSAVLTSTRARVAFIYVFLPGVLLAVLSVFIWNGRRSAMILAFAVAVVLELIMVDNSPDDWATFLPLPVVFGLLLGLALATPVAPAPGAAPARLGDEVYAAVVYFAALLTAFMAPFNHARNFGLPGAAAYALVAGLVLGALSVLIWRGKVWAMVAVFALSLAHWLAQAKLDPLLWESVPFIAAPVVSGILTFVCVAAAAKDRRGPPPAGPSP